MGLDLVGGLVGLVVGALLGVLVVYLFLAIEKGIPRLGRWLLSRLRRKPPDRNDPSKDA